MIRDNTAGGSYERGEQYLREGAVHLLKHDGRELEARVQGGQPLPYAVHVGYDSSGITEVECSCPFHQGTWCKHIAATLLAFLERVEAGQLDEREVEASVEELLGDASRSELVDLFKRMARRDSRIIHWIEEEIA